jgi:protein tyrosine phosphatase
MTFGECLGLAATERNDDDCNRFDPDHYPTVNADGFVDRCTFVVSQCPNSFEADSFWNAVVDNKVSCVVALCSIAADVSNYELIMPLVDGKTAKISRYVISFRAAQVIQDADIRVYSLSVSTRRDERNEPVEAVQPVHIYEFVSWSSNVIVPSPAKLVQLVNQVLYPIYMCALVYHEVSVGTTWTSICRIEICMHLTNV